MKNLFLALTAIAAMTLVVGCSNEKAEEVNSDTDFVADIVVNFEGVVMEVNGNKVTLDTGKTIIISDETAFETQNIGQSEEIDHVIEVGNFIQGYTSGNLEADEIEADVISENATIQINSKIAINIEGYVIAIEENVITLDNGQKFIVNEDTEFETQVEGDKSSSLTKEVNNVFEIGNFVQGFTLDDVEQEVVVALVINSNETL